jgi:peptidoglycan biosynthesis protein MviN/MurJ (putative lipid II flippase)
MLAAVEEEALVLQVLVHWAVLVAVVLVVEVDMDHQLLQVQLVPEVVTQLTLLVLVVVAVLWAILLLLMEMVATVVPESQ